MNKNELKNGSCIENEFKNQNLKAKAIILLVNVDISICDLA